MNERRVSVLLLAAALGALAAGAVPLSPWAARLMAVVFWLVVPGWAITSFTGAGSLVLRLAVAIMLSLALGIALALVMVSIGRWAPTPVGAAVALGSAIVLVAELRRERAG